MSNLIFWNLADLMIRQKQLDHYIHTKKNTNYENTFVERLMALCVELNELANETKCFKYWSENKKIDRTKILEEYVDGLHFSLSLLIYYQLDHQFDIAWVPQCNDQQLSQAFWELNQTLHTLATPTAFVLWFKRYLTLAYQLGFDQTAVYQVYFQKSEINFQRQDNGY